MATLVRQVLLPALICAALTLGSALMFYSFMQKPLGPDARTYLGWAALVGLATAIGCWPVCRVLSRTAAMSVGVLLGFVIPIVTAMIWVRIVDPRLYGWNHPWALPQGMNWRGTDAWSAGLQLAIPSAIGGAIAGRFQSRRVQGSR